MTIAEIQQEILRMKKEQDVCILAHDSIISTKLGCGAGYHLGCIQVFTCDADYRVLVR